MAQAQTQSHFISTRACVCVLQMAPQLEEVKSEELFLAQINLATLLPGFWPFPIPFPSLELLPSSCGEEMDVCDLGVCERLWVCALRQGVCLLNYITMQWTVKYAAKCCSLELGLLPTHCGSCGNSAQGPKERLGELESAIIGPRWQQTFLS